MDRPVISEEEIAFMRALTFDPAATIGFELLSGAVSWSDENVLEFFALSGAHRGAGKELFAYRTSLLIGEPREELRYAWDEARARCPEWIGFRPERITPAPHWPAYVGDAVDSF